MTQTEGRFSKMPNVTIEEFAKSFGTIVEDIPSECEQLINEIDFSYRIIEGIERDRVILDILKKIDTDQQVIASPERAEVWQKGWQEIYDGFVKSGNNLDNLIPKFIRPNQPIRLNQQYIIPNNPNFELDYFRVFRRWLFKKYFEDVNCIYEFGSGTGFNLIELARLYPEKTLYGLDFVSPAVNLVNRIGEVHRFNMKGILFDMIKPDTSLKIEKGGAVYTFGALEQLGGKFEAFLQYILEQSPEIVINLEPTVELYDENHLVDYLAIKFHRKRGYTENYLPSLKKLESEKKLSILKVKRLFFGSQFMEGFSYMIWKPEGEY
jgi:hypothetical protein